MNHRSISHTARPKQGVPRHLLLALAILLLPLTQFPLQAQADQTPRFEPLGLFLFELDGKVLPDAEIYYSGQVGAVLVLTPELPYPIAVVQRNQTLQRLVPSELIKDPAGFIAWSLPATKTAIGEIRLLEDNLPAFSVEGKEARFRTKPPLLGPATLEDIVRYDPSYAYRARPYQPEPGYMSALEEVDTDTLVKIYFSTDCDVCRELLPNIIKVAQELDNPNLRIEFFGLPLKASEHPVGREMNITTFPTGIIYSDGVEVGRAQGHGWRFPSMAIHHGLSGIKVDVEKLLERPSAPPPPE